MRWQDRVENVIRNKTAVGHVRHDPDGSGDMEYFVLIDEAVNQEQVSRNVSNITATADVDREGAAEWLRNPHFGQCISTMQQAQARCNNTLSKRRH